MTKTDFLIIGQGIAGTLFAHELSQRGKDFIVIDSGQHNASLTCAGMVNPVVLKRFSPVWQGKTQILRARETFAQLSDLLNVPLEYRFDILRIFNNEQEKKTWIDKSSLPSLDGLLDTQFYPTPADGIKAPLGVGKIHLSGRMDLHTLLEKYRQHLLVDNKLREEAFAYDKLSISDTHVSYADINARQLVFCEGYGIKQNPYFNYLPLNGNKGEALTVRIPNLRLTATVKSSVFIMPLPEQGDDVYFIGATYHWTDKDNIPTDAGRENLLTKLKKILSKNVYDRIEILDHRAGMRPTVVDRRPLLGQHPEHHNIFIFNGLGTRGVMLGATMAPLLAEFILADSPLPIEVDISRFSN